MLWRSSYHTRELEARQVPPITGISLSEQEFRLTDVGLVFGAFDISAQAELGIWRKLLGNLPSTIRDLDTASPDGVAERRISAWTVYWIEGRDKRLLETLRAMTPGSAWNVTIIASGAGDWKQMIQPDRPDRSFGTLIKNGLADPLMVGLPTEEALARFLSSLG